MSGLLPVHELREDLNKSCAQTRRIILRAPTGSGKSTQIPQMLLDDGLVPDGQIVILQPRRLATRLLAHRVAKERNQPIGEEVGYQIRFENYSSASTRIKFETEGILLRQLITDPTLAHVGAIILDEFHERHLYGDLILARALAVQQTYRPDLLLMVMSATLDTGPLIQYLNPCVVLESKGRTFPVRTQYLDRSLRKEESVMDAAVNAAERVMREGEPGDILIFMPGAYEIQKTLQGLQASPDTHGCVLLPLHGELAPRDQDAAVEQYDRRKIIVSTNVAETSVTIDGIRMVIDSGLARMPRFDPHRGINTLLIERISRSSADQRAGRAGRTAPGLCVRLWTEREHHERALHEKPEIMRLDLSEAIVGLKASEDFDPYTFNWFEAPERASLERALTLLTDLGACDDTTGAITETGKAMASFPAHPRYARMLLEAGQRGCVRQAALVIALSQGRPILQRRTNADARDRRDDALGEHAMSDYFVAMRAWHYAEKNRFDLQTCRRMGVHAQAARQIRPVFEQFLKLAEQQGLPIHAKAADDTALAQCILAGFADQVAKRRDKGTLRCQLVHGRTGDLVRGSVVHDAPLFVASEIDEIQSGSSLNVLIAMATRIDPAWLRELFPHAIRHTTQCLYDPSAKRVVCTRAECYHDLPLEEQRVEPPPLEDAARILVEQIQAGTIPLNKWDDQVDQWLTRIDCLSQWCPEWQYPAVDDALKKLIYEQLCYGHYTAKEVRDVAIRPALLSLLSEDQRARVDTLAPERLDIGGKRPFRLVYVSRQPPYVSARIQELFGVEELPSIAMNRVKPVVHILAPNQRPVQITQDLPGFWRDHYPRIKQELKRKYPKHEWR